MSHSAASVELLSAVERRQSGRTCMLLAVALVACFVLVTRLWWVPVQEIGDQNAYLVGALQLAKTGSPAIQPVHPLTHERDDLQFLSGMWVGVDLGTPYERHYPKYPLGTSLIYAGLLKLGGAEYGRDLVYLAPAAIMGLALSAAYLLMRQTIGPIWALPCLIAVATSPAVIRAVRSTKSHTLSMLCICLGLWLLMEWWRKGGRARAILVGLVLGYSVIVRYTDGLMLLPMLLVIAFRYSREDRPQWLRESLTMLLAWAIFPAAQVAFNLAATGMITGYSQTNESTAFALRGVSVYWHTCRHLFLYGITLCVPVGVIGMLWGLRRNWRMAAVLIATAIPVVLVYGSYSWHYESASAAFARFFTAILPLFVVASACLVLGRWDLSGQWTKTPWWRRGMLLTLLAGTVTWNLYDAIPATREEYLFRLNIGYQREMLDRVAPADAVIIGPNALLSDLQFSRDSWYLIRKQVLLRHNLAPASMPAVGARRSVVLRGMPFASVPIAQRPAVMTGAIEDFIRAGQRVFLVAEEDEPAIVLDRKRLEFAPIGRYGIAQRIPKGLPRLGWNSTTAFARFADVAGEKKWSLYELRLKPAAALR